MAMAEILVALGTFKKLPKSSGVTEMREPNHGTMMKNDETRLLGGNATVEIVFIFGFHFVFVRRRDVVSLVGSK